MKLVKQKSPLDNVADIEPGTYEAVLKDIRQRTLPVTTERGVENREVLEWVFDVDGKEVTGLTSIRVTDRSKAGRWIKLILGKDFEEIDTSELIGKQVIVTIEHRKRGSGDNVRLIPHVIEIAPMPKKRATQTKKTKEESEDIAEV